MSPTIQNPAPAFTVTAFVEGALKEVSLSDYLGKWYIRALTLVILCILTILTRRFLGLYLCSTLCTFISKLLSKSLSDTSSSVTLPLSAQPRSSRSTTRFQTLRA